ncbi:MAG TPA: 3-phosphoshikimate 1-carboxyvinyltransferase [Rickettsiales bacterium]|nr:3-phosphoshikimate 1-carboxyvinyltransferase [Rickettsiales bacterium]
MQIEKISKINDISIEILGSKSYTNRALIIASLADGKTILHNPLYSDDTEYMIKSLEKLGVKFEKKDKNLTVYGTGGKFNTFENLELFCGIAGTTSRFLTGLLVLSQDNLIINGEGKILERPIGELVDGLRQIGANIEYLGKEGSLPLKGNGKNINGNEIAISGEISSQYFTALLMVAPMLKNGLKIKVIDEQVSKSYIDITCDIMKQFGVDVINNDYKEYIVKPAKYKAREYNIEGDWSSASYFCCIGALHDGSIEITNVNNNSVQGDKNFPKLIEKAGGIVEYKENSIIVKKGEIKPIEVDMELMPDTAMSLAVFLSFANGNSKITGLSTLKDKETNRLVVLQSELKKLSIESEIGDDFIVIKGGNPKVIGEIETYNDHRIAMSFAIVGTKLDGLVIKNPEVVKKSFPEFWDYLKKLQG